MKRKKSRKKLIEEMDNFKCKTHAGSLSIQELKAKEIALSAKIVLAEREDKRLKNEITIQERQLDWIHSLLGNRNLFKLELYGQEQFAREQVVLYGLYYQADFKDSIVNVSIQQFAKNYGLTENDLRESLSLLERNGVIQKELGTFCKNKGESEEINIIRLSRLVQTNPGAIKLVK